jgi:hypothetical protein
MNIWAYDTDGQIVAKRRKKKINIGTVFIGKVFSEGSFDKSVNLIPVGYCLLRKTLVHEKDVIFR